MKFNIGEKPHSCKGCNRNFQSRVFEHELIYFGNEPYQSKYCEETFGHLEENEAVCDEIEFEHSEKLLRFSH